MTMACPDAGSATCRTHSGMCDNGYISDISPHGCRLATSTLAVRIGARIVIRPQGSEGLMGIVRWIDGQHAGIEFEAPLYEPVVDHLSQLHAAGTPVGVFASGLPGPSSERSPERGASQAGGLLSPFPKRSAAAPGGEISQ